MSLMVPLCRRLRHSQKFPVAACRLLLFAGQWIKENIDRYVCGI